MNLDELILKVLKEGQPVASSMTDYEFYIDKDKLVHVLQAQKETSKPMNVEAFKIWLSKRWPGKDPNAIITQLNKTGKFSENQPPVDLTAGGEVI